MGRLLTASVVLLGAGVVIVAVASAAGPEAGLAGSASHPTVAEVGAPKQLEQLAERGPQRGQRFPKVIPAPGAPGIRACDDRLPPLFEGTELPPSSNARPVPLPPSAGEDCIEYPPEGCSLLVEGSGPVGSCTHPNGARQLPPGVKRIATPTG